jgi:hypothetical protein
METPPPARPDIGQHAQPVQAPPSAQSSSGRTVAIVVTAVVGALVLLAFIIVIAVALIGRSASSQFQQIGDCVNGRNNPTCSSAFPAP